VHIFEVIYFGLSLLFAPLMASVQFAFWEKVNSFRANGWQPMQCIVHKVDAFQDNAFWHADLSYYYSWEGEFYSGYRRRVFGREKDSDQFTASFPGGASLMIRVNPDAPDRSILLLDEQFARS
jgi:hypothetical protein